MLVEGSLGRLRRWSECPLGRRGGQAPAFASRDDLSQQVIRGWMSGGPDQRLTPVAVPPYSRWSSWGKGRPAHLPIQHRPPRA